MTPSSPLERACSLDLTCDLAAPRTARRVVELMLAQWGVQDGEAVDAATIVVSELVTNVLVHCDDGGPMTLSLQLHDDALIISVADREPTVPAQREAGEHDESGRGLGIVDQIATRWSVQQCDQGKRVVVELPLASAWCA